MTTPYYSVTGAPSTSSSGSSSVIRAEYAAIEAGFALLPTLSGAGGRIPYINSGATAHTTASGLSFDGTSLTASNIISSGTVKVAAGTVSLPAIYLSTDTTSGLYRIAANNIGIAISAAKVVDIATAGVAITGTLSATGHVTLEGVTSTGATGTGKIVYDTAPTLGAITVTSINSTTIPSSATLLTSGGALGTPSSGTLTSCTFPTLNQNTSGSAATLTTARAIYGNNFDGSAALTQVIASAYGGTGNGFTKFTGPLTTEKTFTLPDATSTIVVQGGALGTPSSGTLTSCTFPTLNQNTSGSAASLSATLIVAQGGTGAATLTANNVILGNGTTAVQFVAPSTSGNVLKSNGTTWTSGSGGAATPEVQTFTSSSTWTKPTGGQTWARIQVWGAGGGAGRSDATSGGMGGAGGAYHEVIIPLSYIDTGATVTVGTGGAGRSGSAGTGTVGGTSSVVLASYPGGSKTMYAYGGGAGGSDYSTVTGNVIGGGQLSAGGLDSAVLTTGRPRQTGDQGDTYTPTSGAIMWGGGNVTIQNLIPPGETVFGGAAGGFMVVSTVVNGGQSVWGGNGGNGHATAPTAGTIPGGGGGGGGVSVNGAAGADGKIIITSY